MKNMLELRSKLLKMEKGKTEVNVAQMSEVLAKLSELMFKDESISKILIKNGKRRMRRIYDKTNS